MGRPKRIPTPEEYEKDKPIILDAYRAGLPVLRMVDKFAYTKTYIVKIKQMLINEGLITEEEIKSAFEKYMKEHPASQGLDKSRVRKSKSKEKFEKRHNKSLEDKEKILQLVKQKYTKSQIARELGSTATKVDRHIKELIQEGKLKGDEIEKGSSGSNDDIIDRNSQEYLKQIEKIVECLRRGWKNFYIRKVLNITPYEFDIYIKDIKRKKIMTLEEIKEARERKYQEDLKFVADCINDGLACTEIRELKPEFSYNEVTPMIKQLIDLGIITREKVEENRKNTMKRTINKTVELSPEEQTEFILNKVKKGYTPSEIVESDKTKSLTIHKVLYQKRQLIAKGIISQEEVDKAMQQRQERFLAEKHERVINEIKRYTELGYTLIEMSEFITDYVYEILCRIRNDYIKENGWYTKEELKEFTRLRQIREFKSLPPAEKRRIEEEKMAEVKRLEEEKRQQKIDEQNRKKEENELRIKKEVMQLREYIEQGYTYKEISQYMCYSVAYLGTLRNFAVGKNIWFTKLEIRNFRKLREKREQLEEEKNRIEEQKRLEEERKAKEEIKEEEERRNIERKQKIKEYKRLYNICKKEAKKEDKLELKGQEDVSTEGRRKLIEVLVTLQNLGVYINDEDIDIVLNTFYMYPEIANKDSIRFLISDACKKGDLRSTEKMILELLNTLRDTKFYKPLVEYRKWARKLNFLPEIRVMKKDGMNNTQIAANLGITSAEVSIILNNDRTQIFNGIGLDDD